EIWFTAGGAGKWWPESGAEGLTLTQPAAGQWRLAEIDGTVSDFSSVGGADAKLWTTSPPVAAGQTRLVYEATPNGLYRLRRMIAPLDPGVDPGNPQAPCTTATPAAGCEVLDLVYASSTTATSSGSGDYAGQV